MRKQPKTRLHKLKYLASFIALPMIEFNDAWYTTDITVT